MTVVRRCRRVHATTAVPPWTWPRKKPVRDGRRPGGRDPAGIAAGDVAADETAGGHGTAAEEVTFVDVAARATLEDVAVTRPPKERVSGGRRCGQGHGIATSRCGCRERRLCGCGCIGGV